MLRWSNPKFKLLFLTPKAAFLISPLDMGFFTMFKRAYYKYDRSSYALKIMAANQVWKTFSRDKIVNLFNNCGITSTESPKRLNDRIVAQVRGGIPEEVKKFGISIKAGWRELSTLKGLPVPELLQRNIC